LLVAEHDAGDDSAPASAQAPGDGVRKRRAEPITDAAEAASPANDPPAIRAKDDVHSLMAQPGSLIEPVLRRPR
jgi:hypothetical protein